MRRKLLAVVIVASLFGAACSGSKPEAQTVSAGATVAVVSPKTGAAKSAQAGATPKEVHLCGAATQAGGTCKRHVKAEGDHCYQHGGAAK